MRKFYILLALSAILVFCGCSGPYDEVINNDVGIRLPIIMYHSVVKDNSRAGRYVITDTELENDLKFLKENGYTTVFMKDAIDYVTSGTPLPDKPIVLTFDDGCTNNLTYGLPLLEKYDSRALISVVGSYTDKFSEIDDKNPNYAYLTWEDIRELDASARVEIGNHTNDMHYCTKGKRKGCEKLWKESEEDYQSVLTEDLQTMQKKCAVNLGFIPYVFTYPYGIAEDASQAVIDICGFQASLSCEEGVNTLVRNDTAALFMMKRCIRTNKRSVSDILKKIS